MWTAANFIIEDRMRSYGRRLCTVALDQPCPTRGPVEGFVRPNSGFIPHNDNLSLFW